jgi:arsenate reductase
MSRDHPITIFHNPACGTSRSVVSMVRSAGYEPEVVEYLRTGWSRAKLEDLLSRAGLTVRAAMREKEPLAAELGLLDPGVPDDVIFDAMLEHPILVNRPFVVTPLGVRLCRPSETVLDLLDAQPPATSEQDGQGTA